MTPNKLILIEVPNSLEDIHKQSVTNVNTTGSGYLLRKKDGH